MKQLDLRDRRWLGLGLIVLALVLDVFLWLVAGSQALLVGVSSGALLIVFGGLFLSGRWPPAHQGKESH